MASPDGSFRRFAAPAFAATLVLAAWPLAGQPLPGPPKGKPAALPVAAPVASARPELVPAAEAHDSPRASVRAFVELTKRGDYRSAARYLVLPPGDETRGPELARRLRAVLERHGALHPDRISGSAEGAVEDGLPPGIDSVGLVTDTNGRRDPVFVVRTRDAAGPLWAFSRQTVAQLDAWYDALPDRWVRDWMPERLQRHGPAELMWWQWLALPVLLGVALAIGRLLGVATTRLLSRLARHTPTPWDDRLVARASPALTLLGAAAAATLLLPWLALLPGARADARSALGGIATLAVFWALWRSVDVWAQFLLERPWAADNPSARSLISVTRNLAKVLVGTGGLVAVLGALGYPVATVLAGLGIGGIALAFGAQKTIENLFGSLAIAADQPFRVGDLVKVDDVTGNVERIGMRSTQIRTAERTLVSLPNGKLADLRVEDFASRDRIRFTTTVSLAHGTSEAQIRQIVSGIERQLRAMPKIWADGVVAKLAAFGATSLEIEVLCWFATTSFDEFRELRQDALFGILVLVEQAGASLASPSRTVYVEQGPPPPDRPLPDTATNRRPSDRPPQPAK